MDTLQELAVGVAAALGEGWEIGGGYSGYRRRLGHNDGRSLLLEELDGGRIHISGVYGHMSNDLLYSLIRPSVTVAVNRGAEAIARVAKSRVLPSYEADLARVLEQQTTAGDAATVAHITALPCTMRHRSLGERVILAHPDGQWHGTAEVRADGAEVSLEISGIPAGVAIEMLAILTESAVDDCAICPPGQCPGPDCPGNYAATTE